MQVFGIYSECHLMVLQFCWNSFKIKIKKHPNLTYIVINSETNGFATHACITI